MDEFEQKQNWSPCPTCAGIGKVMHEVSKKRRRRYQRELSINKPGIKVPEKSVNVCLACTGSGLLSIREVTPLNSDYPHIAIIGGGIGGVALAVACHHRGIPYTLYEKDTSFDSRSQGYGLTLQQASKAIEALGIFSLENGIISTKHVVHTTDGTVIGEWGMRKWLDSPARASSKRKNIHIARQSLRSQLITQLGGPDSVQWNHKLVGLSKNTNTGMGLEFQVGKATKKATADLVVGADGIYSQVRKTILEEDKNSLQYLGCIVILGICPLENIENITSPLLDSETVFQTVNGTERIYMMPYDADTIMWQLSFPMPESDAKKLSQKGPVEMKKDALQRLENWHDPITQVLHATGTQDITGYPVYDRKPADSALLHKAGNISLIGDAAHPMSPFKGQGANQAILDGLSLARHIAECCKSKEEWRKNGLRKTILNTFEKEMLERTKSKVLGSAKAANLLHSEAVLHKEDQPRGRGV